MSDAVFFALISSAVSAAALALIARFGDTVRQASRPLSIAAGGMLLTLVSVHIGPEAIAQGQNSWIFLAAGALLGFCLRAGLKQVSALALQPAMATGGGSNSSAGSGTPAWAYTLAAGAPLLAIAIHSTLDGAVYGLAFTGGHEAGFYAVSALILHEIPEAFVAFALASAAGMATRPAVLAALLAASLTTPIGTAMSETLLASAASSMMPAIFAMSAGLLTFVAVGPLLSPLFNPPAEGEDRGWLALGAGIVMAGLLMTVPLPHGHHGFVDDGAVPVHAHSHHDHAPGDGHDHPSFSPFR